MSTREEVPSAAGVRAAARRLQGATIRTPLLENEWLNERAGGRILMKAETLQHGGSFKFRGAMNRLAHLTPEERRRGVLAVSSGNHAQGVARAARLFGASATILMPKDAPAFKIAQVRAYGGETHFYDRYKDDREALARTIAAERGLAIAHPFDQVETIEGQGTLALEAAEDAAAIGASFDAFICCCGGGGMAAGCATILAELSPATEMMIAEPEGFDEAWASIREGRRVTADVGRRTICDSLAAPATGTIALPILARHVRAGVAVTDDEVAETVAFAATYLKLVVEPGGAAALAAVYTRKIKAEGRTIGVTLSGGNIDPSLLATILGRFS